MARITNPLHSLTASGTLAGAVTFLSGKHGAIAKSYKIQTKTRTPAQDAHRLAFGNIMKWWQTLTADEKRGMLEQRETWLEFWQLYYPESYKKFAAARPTSNRTDWEILIGYMLVDW